MSVAAAALAVPADEAAGSPIGAFLFAWTTEYALSGRRLNPWPHGRSPHSVHSSAVRSRSKQTADCPASAAPAESRCSVRFSLKARFGAGLRELTGDFSDRRVVMRRSRPGSEPEHC